MKNKKILESMDKISPDEASKKQILDNVLKYNHSRNEGKVINMRNNKTWKTFIPAAAILALVMTFALPNLLKNNNPDVLVSKGNIEVSYIDDLPELPPGNPGAITMNYSEADVFQLVGNDVFTGTVKSIRNIRLSYLDVTEYRAIVTVTIDKVLRGDKKVGEDVKMMLPGPVEDGKVIGVDFHVTRAMKVGEKGVFLPIRHDDQSYWEDNNTKVYFSEIAEYSILDTQKFVFLDVNGELLFAKDAFPALQSAKTLDEVEVYISSKLR